MHFVFLVLNIDVPACRWKANSQVYIKLLRSYPNIKRDARHYSHHEQPTGSRQILVQ